MKYIAAIDHTHLDDGVFLSDLSKSIAQQQNTQPIIIHADSAYTERIIQTGVMRKEATIRAQKDLNHRLVALMADESISAVGLHGYQRKTITLTDNELTINQSFLNQVPTQSVLVLSTLVWDKATSSPQPLSITRLLSFLQNELSIDPIFAFDAAGTPAINRKEEQDDKTWNELPQSFREAHLPEEFHNFGHPLYLTTGVNFHSLPKLNGCCFIH